MTTILDKIFFSLNRVFPTIWKLPNILKIYEYQQLVSDVPFNTEQKILDLGCGQGTQAQLLAMRGPRVFGIDPIERFVKSAEYKRKWSIIRSRVEFACGTIEKVKFPPNTFDYVFSFCVLEHIPNLDEVLKELKRVLKPGGQIHATVDALCGIDDPDVLKLHSSIYHVIQYFRPDTLEKQLAAAGFKVIEQRYILKSQLAYDEFIRDLEEKPFPSGLINKIKLYRNLCQQESLPSTEDRGVMILFRAVRL